MVVITRCVLCVHPLQGVSYLVEKGMLVYEPRAVATFLLENCDKLDKTQIGEYLGKEVQYKDGFCVQVGAKRERERERNTIPSFWRVGLGLDKPENVPMLPSRTLGRKT